MEPGGGNDAQIEIYYLLIAKRRKPIHKKPEITDK